MSGRPTPPMLRQLPSQSVAGRDRSGNRYPTARAALVVQLSGRKKESAIKRARDRMRRGESAIRLFFESGWPSAGLAPAAASDRQGRCAGIVVCESLRCGHARESTPTGQLCPNGLTVARKVCGTRRRFRWKNPSPAATQTIYTCIPRAGVVTDSLPGGERGAAGITLAASR